MFVLLFGYQWKRNELVIATGRRVLVCEACRTTWVHRDSNGSPRRISTPVRRRRDGEHAARGNARQSCAAGALRFAHVEIRRARARVCVCVRARARFRALGCESVAT